MDLDDIKSGDEYADLLIGKMMLTQTKFKGEGLNPTIFENWCKKIRKMCRESYRDYEKGRKEEYKLSDVEMGKAYDDAISEYVDEMLEGLIDRGLVEMAVSEQGEIVYGLSNKGRGYANLLKDIMENREEEEDDDFEN